MLTNVLTSNLTNSLLSAFAVYTVVTKHENTVIGCDYIERRWFPHNPFVFKLHVRFKMKKKGKMQIEKFKALFLIG